MSTVIDRRSEPSKGSLSHERLMQRTKQAARNAIKKSIEKGAITNMGKGGVDVVVPKEDLSEPRFQHGAGGIRERVLPGNNNEEAQFHEGDKIPRPAGGQGGQGSSAGKEASENGGGEDSFTFHLSEQEFLNLLFEELELPNLFKTTGKDLEKTTVEQAGFSRRGTYNRLNLTRSKIEKTKREVTMNRGHNHKIIVLLQEKKGIYEKYGYGQAVDPLFFVTPLSPALQIRHLQNEITALQSNLGLPVSEEDKNRLAQIDQNLDALYDKKKLVRKWNDKLDLRYRAVEEEPLPASRAVMFCEMDVSGSMSEDMKSNAKVFFFLLHRFLQRQYDHVDIVFIRHHEKAEEVPEKEFFEGRVTGGTVVSTAHEELLRIQTERYPEHEWNIYVAQASDGDNLASDNPRTEKLMRMILPMVQGFFHVEIEGWSRGAATDLWKVYEPLAKEFSDRFWMKKVKEKKDVWPVFHDLFKKRADNSTAKRNAAFTLG